MKNRAIPTIFGFIVIIVFAFIFLIFPVYSYFTQRTALKVAENVELLYDVTYGNADGKDLKMNIYRLKGSSQGLKPAIVWIHGGGWASGSKDEFSEVLSYIAQQGYVLASVEYRFSDEYKFPAQIADCKCAVRFLRAKAKDYHINPDKIGVWGASAGGHLSMLMGTTAGIKEFEGSSGWKEYSSNVQAVCSWSGVSDFTAAKGKLAEYVENLIGKPCNEAAAVWKKASPVEYVRQGLPPFMIVHGKKDQLVPYEQGVLMYNALKKAKNDAFLDLIENADHSLNDPNIFIQSIEFFNKNLKS